MRREKKRKPDRGVRGFLHVLQHLLLAVAVIAILVVTTGSTVIIQGVSGSTSYSLHTSDQDKTYEESELFNTIFGRSVADIIRFGVIRSQLETNGEFDNDKIIDVTAYNYRDEDMPARYVTARYYLGDLLKWCQYGLEYSSVAMTKEQAEQFFADRTILTIVDPESKYYNTTDVGYMKSDIGAYTFMDDVSSNMLPSDEWNENPDVRLAFEVLVNRYKTVEGKNIEDYTADLSHYTALCNSVAAAMESLTYNYKEYLDYLEYYASDNTNLRYCIEKTIGDRTEYFTNMEDLLSEDELTGELKNENMLAYFNKRFGDKFGGDKGKYIFYSPSEMIYESNSAIKESTIRNILKEYDYAYPETIRIWVGVDAAYPVKDALAQGKAGFQNYLPYFWQWIILVVAAVLLYFTVLLYLTGVTGKAADEEGKAQIRLTGFDRIPTEAVLALAALVIILLIAVGKFLWTDGKDLIRYEDLYTTGFKIGAGILAFLLDIVFALFYYSLVRRVKAKTLWQDSFLRILLRKGSACLLDIYDNGSIIVRTWVPFLIMLVFNLLMIMVGLYTSLPAVVGLLVAFVIDMMIGFMLYTDVKERQSIVEGIKKIAEGDFSYQVNQENMHGDNLILAKSVNSIGKGIKNAVEISMKDERMKADLITNVSHDIKTPLTSIINYVDLIKREEVNNERVRSYIRVLDEKSQRLKQLTDDLVEASKISSGNINLHFEKINLTELLNQTIGEFSEKFEEKGLTIVMNVNASNVMIEADSRSIWRVMENLFNNIYKYALEGTRVYIIIHSLLGGDERAQEIVEVSIKNISANELNCNPEELTERFIRGDESRTTEGSGLGLSIAKNLTEAQHGTFEIQLDGDLFKVILTFQTIL